MRKNENRVNIEGRLFSAELEMKVTGATSKAPGTEYITGSINIATDDKCLNVIPVHYTYVTAMTKAGKANNTFTSLKKIIDGQCKTVSADGFENAQIIRAQPSLALNDFWSTRDEQFVASPRNEGGFITLLSDASKLKPENERSKFSADIVITGVNRVEADPDKNIEKDFVQVRAAAFDFRNAILPFNFVVKSEGGMNYFEGLGVTGANPVYLNVWGTVKNAAIVQERTTESAFGEAKVETVTNYIREWVITGASTVPYDFGEEGILTTEEFQKAISDRNLYLAERKKNAEEYAAKASQGDTLPFDSNGNPATSAVKNQSFDF